MIHFNPERQPLYADDKLYHPENRKITHIALSCFERIASCCGWFFCCGWKQTKPQNADSKNHYQGEGIDWSQSDVDFDDEVHVEVLSIVEQPPPSSATTQEARSYISEAEELMSRSPPDKL